MRIALVVEEAAGAQTLRRVAATSHEIAFVLSADAPAGEGGVGSGGRISAIARDIGVTVGDPKRVRDPAFATQLRAAGVDVLLNVHSLHLIHPEVLRAVRFGAFNLHPGPLPEYAGLNTVSWAIFEGASEYGVTLHWMANDVDTGAIAYSTRFPVDGDMTAARLMSRSVREGLQLLDRFLIQLENDPSGVPAEQQDLSRRRYFDRRIPCGGRVDWAALTAREVVSLVRACDYSPFASPWGQTRATINGVETTVVRCRMTGLPSDQAPGTSVLHSTGGVLRVAARDEWVEVQEAFPLSARV